MLLKLLLLNYAIKKFDNSDSDENLCLFSLVISTIFIYGGTKLIMYIPNYLNGFLDIPIPAGTMAIL